MHQILSGVEFEQKNQLDFVVHRSLLSGSGLLKPRDFAVYAVHHLRCATHLGVGPILFRMPPKKVQVTPSKQRYADDWYRLCSHHRGGVKQHPLTSVQHHSLLGFVRPETEYQVHTSSTIR